MALFMPSFVTPDVRSGIGLGTVDATAGMTVSWRINGPSALQYFSITIYTNDANSTQKYTTGKISTGCPAYGTASDGTPQLFSYTISAATLSGAGITNGNQYKLVIQQWWSANSSVTQASASVFFTRKAPTLSISAIGTGGVIQTRYYTFTGNYSQANGDTMNWFRWQIAYANDTDNPFYDSGHITGTMQLSCYYDGFLNGGSYAVRLTAQTEKGVEADTGWKAFSSAYVVPTTTGDIVAECTPETDAVHVVWSGIGAYPGTAVGSYSISTDHVLTLSNGGTITWEDGLVKPMNMDAPWSVIWKGQLGNSDCTVFTVKQTGGDITLNYSYSAQSLILKKGSTTLASQSGIINTPIVTALLTEDTLYLRVVRPGGGLYPATTLYPSSTLYPKADSAQNIGIFTLPVSYTQNSITLVQIGGYQICNYLEVQIGTSSAETIAAAITDGTYVPTLNSGNYMLVNWTNGINAGSLDIGDNTIIGFALYRMQAGSTILKKVAETDPYTEELYDYGAKSQQGPYTYYLFPIGDTSYIAEPLVSNTVDPCWWNWTLIDCEETADKNVFSVTAAYRFQFNVNSGSMTNNNTPGLQQNFTQYPTIQLSPQNYKSATLSGLIGSVNWINGQPEYADTIASRDAIQALSVSQNPMFLKNRKGDLFRIKISGAIGISTDDSSIEQMQSASVPWSEVGSAAEVSLYSLQNRGIA